MGWKMLKQALGTDCHIQVSFKGVCIGSGSAHDLAVIDPDTGRVEFDSAFREALIKRCPRLFELAPEDIKRLLAAEDQFERSVPVYTFQEGAIVEKWCEEPGWPNVTHDGCMMFINTFSTDKEQVVAWAKQNASAQIEHLQDEVEGLKRELAEKIARLNETRAIRGKLEANYPSYTVRPA